MDILYKNKGQKFGIDGYYRIGAVRDFHPTNQPSNQPSTYSFWAVSLYV